MTVPCRWPFVDARQLLSIEVAYKGSDSDRSDRKLRAALISSPHLERHLTTSASVHMHEI
ncbi:hypothetical protein K443DRAFT_627544 [Laccaria amethystina LaAM-08-1]|uniref:Uncharacterized protein n=1 Tax=Laccaria amethystina LaAM-08-1 TaxID=1095629 RepID=A0A0C9YAS0_9AGAR|nr:hypothetical protein K443DRAFT_627544 [Laccaria amethystina LaAM-08-1]